MGRLRLSKKPSLQRKLKICRNRQAVVVAGGRDEFETRGSRTGTIKTTALRRAATAEGMCTATSLISAASPGCRRRVVSYSEVNARHQFVTAKIFTVAVKEKMRHKQSSGRPLSWALSFSG